MKYACMLLLAGVLAVGGCGLKSAHSDLSVAEHEGLAVGIKAEPTILRPGQTVTITVVARNQTGKAMEIPANSSALVHLRIYHNAGVRWEQVRRYPEAAAMVYSPWTLPAGGERRWTIPLVVAPDWPRNEPLRLTAELNGREKPRAAALIRVVDAQLSSE